MGDWNFRPGIEETRQKENQTPHVASKHLLEGSLLFVNKTPEAHEKAPLDEMVEQKITREGKRVVHEVGHRSTVPTEWLHEGKSKSQLIGRK